MYNKMVLGPAVCLYTWKGRSVYFGNRMWSRGLTKVIQHVFAPNYRFQRLPRRLTGTLRRGAAKKRGHAIDQAMSRWVHAPTVRTSLHEVRTLITLFESYCWVPIAAQLVVAWPGARLATKIDLVLSDGHERLYVIEIKSGCLYRRASHGMLRHCTPPVSNAPIHQHQLQALLGKELLVRTYPTWSRANVESILVYVTPDAVEMIREAEFGVTYTDTMRQILEQTA